MKKPYSFLLTIVFVLFFIIAATKSYGQAPAISSVSPSSGGVGASVTISGSNFSATAANNVVYFGAVSATVTSASTSQLMVTVPAGASYGPITVYNTGGTVPLVGTSGRTFFTPTFPSRNSIISADFDSRTDITVNSTVGTSTKQLGIADLNGDGLPDMVVTDLLAKTLLIFQHATNSASFGAVYPATGTAFAYTLSGTNAVSNFVLADMNGDGKPDLVMSVNNSTYIYLNTSTTGGAVSFSTTSAITPFGTSTANELAVADMDGDGRPDIMTCNGNLGTVKLYQNITSGSTLSFNTTAVSIYPGNSSSTAATDATHYCYSMLIGDMDGDGKPDIVVSNQQASGVGSGYISIVRNISSPGTLNAASFSAALSGALIQTGQQALNSNTNNFVLGDIDGDGKLDIVIAESTDKTVSVIQNSSTSGSFSFNSRITQTTSAVASPKSVALADMDGDGRVDIVVDNYTNSSSSQLFALIRNLSTAFGTLTAASFGANVSVALGQNSNYLAVNDIDGDGKPELLSSNSLNGTVTIWHNNPASPVVISTLNPASGSTAATGTSTSSLATGTNVTLTGSNFNSTAANNLVFFGATKATVSSATATQLTVNVPPGASYGAVSVTNTALNSVTNKSVYGQSQAIFKPTFTSKGNITASDFDTRIDLTITATGNKSVIVKDVDGDGLPDLITLGGNTVNVFHQVNTGTVTNLASASFSTAVSYPVGGNITQLIVTDVDGDGLQDILAASDANQEVSLLRNINTTIGTPSFATVVNLNPGSQLLPVGVLNVNSIQLTDIDGDGKPDLVIQSNTSTGTYSNPLIICRNVSTPGAAFSNSSTVGTFAAATFITNIPGTYVASNNINVSAADLDGDGKPDLVISAGSTNNTLYIYHNNSTRGNLSFDNIASPITIATGNSPQFAAVGDLDGDGLLDIAVPNGNDNTVSLFRNTSTSGSISFNTTATVVATGTNPVFVTLADIDGDGKADVLAANNPSASRSISILRNTSTSGAISTAAKVDLLLPTSAKAYSIAVNDLDLDGKADIVVANGTINPGISLFRNLSVPNIVYYSKSTGDLSTLSTYGTNADGTGTAPTDFNGSGTTATYQLANRSNYTLTTALTLGSTLNIPSGSTLDLAGNALTLTTLNGTGTLTGSNTSSLTVNGTISSLAFATGKEQLGSLTLGSGANLTMSSFLAIASTGTVTLGATSIFNTNNTLSLRSDASGTAQIAALGTGASISGGVTVERYLADKRSWRLIAPSVYSVQTINAAWQEGAGGGLTNPNPGYGTFIVGNSTANGFDIASTSGSLLSYNGTALSSVANTNSLLLNAYPAYFLFSIGNRGVNPATAGVHSSTTLRSYGSVITGTQPVTVNAAGYTLVGNPYPAPVDFSQITRSASVPNQFYAWDINLGTYGGYVLVSYNGSSYTSVPTSPSGLTNIIPEGAAIFVQSDGTITGTLTLNESSKATGTGSNTFSNFNTIAATTTHDIRVNLTDASSNLIDGVMASFASTYSSAVDNNDAKKLPNFYENIALARSGSLLTLERRADITSKDSIMIRLSGLKTATYQLQVDPATFNEPGMTARLEDAYLHTSTTLDPAQVSSISFNSTTDTATYKNRFKITFNPTLNTVMIKKPLEGAKVIAYPNPATGKQINLTFDGVPIGSYNITVSNTFGRVMQKSTMVYSGSTSNKTLSADYTTGVYTVNIQSASYNQSIKVIVP